MVVGTEGSEGFRELPQEKRKLPLLAGRPELLRFAEPSDGKSPAPGVSPFRGKGGHPDMAVGSRNRSRDLELSRLGMSTSSAGGPARG